jgi:hypothetical protein
MTTVSEQLQNRITVSEKVVASARTHAPKIAATLGAQAAEVEGAATPATSQAFEAVISAMANGLEHSTKTMRDKEQTVVAEKADDGPIRIKREEVTRILGGLLVRLRSTVEDHLGPEGLRAYGLAGEASRVPRKVLEQAKNVVQLFEKNPVVSLSPFGDSFHSSFAVTALSSNITTLETLVVDDDREVRELEDAFAARDRAVAAWTDVYQGTATVLEGLYRRAGFKELADKVRPTVRKVRGDDPGEEETAPQETRFILPSGDPQ